MTIEEAKKVLDLAEEKHCEVSGDDAKAFRNKLGNAIIRRFHLDKIKVA